MPRSSFSGTSPGSNHTSLVLCVTTRSFWKEEPRQVCAERRMTLLSAAGCRVQNLVNLWNLASYQAGSSTRVGTCLWYAWTRRSVDDPASHALVFKHRHTWIKVSVLWHFLKTYEYHWREFCNVIFLLWKLKEKMQRCNSWYICSRTGRTGTLLECFRLTQYLLLN